MRAHAAAVATLTLALTLALAACGRTAPAERTAPPVTGPTGEAPVERDGLIQRDGFWTLEEAPPPLACVTDDDCLGDTVPAEDLCCQDPHKVAAHSSAWRTFIQAWRDRSCGDHACPPPPSPSQPPACAFEVRCQAGRCVDDCPR